MKIIVGSMNKAKVKAVETIFPNSDVTPFSALSNVSSQPLTNRETRKGAINRAYYCYKEVPDAICFGLEGGVTIIDDELYLCSWGALVVEGELYTAGGPNILLPSQFIEPLQMGVELAQLMEEYTSLKNVRQKEGAVGIFTNGVVSRSELFSYIVKLLKGQMIYKRNQLN